MKKIFQMVLLLLLISSAMAQESSPQETQPQETQKILRDYDWKDLARQHELSIGEVISMDRYSVLKIKKTNDLRQDISLLKISDSSIIKGAHFLVCEATKNEDVPGSLRLSFQLLCSLSPVFPRGVGRTIEAGTDNGGTIYGTNWTLIKFAVVRDALVGSPTQLELHLVWEARGTIYVRPIRVFGVAGSWWSSQQIGLIGGIGGSVIGCFGALLGWLARKGKARNFVLTTVRIFIGLGILLTIAGLVAVALKQPYAVWYALLLPGVILTLIFSLNLPSIQRRYDDLEIRRMASIDAMGS
jgi:hypothetical protein